MPDQPGAGAGVGVGVGEGVGVGVLDLGGAEVDRVGVLDVGAPAGPLAAAEPLLDPFGPELETPTLVGDAPRVAVSAQTGHGVDGRLPLGVGARTEAFE